MFKKIYLFIPGYYGSTLKERNKNRLVWGDPKELFFKRSSLALPIEGINIPGVLDLHPHSVIPDMQILGGLLKEESYDKTLHFLKALDDTLDVIQIAWDWRKEPLNGALKIQEAIDFSKNKYPNCEYILVSHSYGSLAASYYLRYGIQEYDIARETWEGLQHFSKVILSACPYKGLMAIFRNMHKGIKFGFNHKMQDALTFSTFQSSYFLIPPQGLDKIKDAEGNSKILGLYDPANWIENRWGLFHEQHKIEKNEKLKSYLSTNLLQSKKFHELMSKPIEVYPKKNNQILYLQGHGFKTLHEGVWLNNQKASNIFLYYPKDFKKWKPKKIKYEDVYGDGDSTVPDFSLKIPEAFISIGTEIYKDHLGHLDILQSDKSQLKIKHFLES